MGRFVKFVAIPISAASFYYWQNREDSFIRRNFIVPVINSAEKVNQTYPSSSSFLTGQNSDSVKPWNYNWDK